MESSKPIVCHSERCEELSLEQKKKHLVKSYPRVNIVQNILRYRLE
jgi:hypothetical protein